MPTKSNNPEPVVVIEEPVVDEWKDITFKTTPTRVFSLALDAVLKGEIPPQYNQWTDCTVSLRYDAQTQKVFIKVE